MRCVVGLVLLLSLALPLQAQPKYVVAWADTMDTGPDDYATGVAIDRNSNVYVTGYFYNGSNYDYLTVKYDSMGNVVWADTINIGDYDGAVDIAVDGSGNVYVTGFTNDGSNSHCITVKYNSQGDVIWVDTLGRGNSDVAYGIAVDENSNVYITGSTNSGSSIDYLTVKYNSLGDVVWTNVSDFGSSEEASGVTVDRNGNVFVTGYISISSRHYYLTVKYDSMGNIVWVDTLEDGNEAKDIAVDENGNVYVTGYASVGSGDNYFTVKYDSMGNVVWEDTLENGNAYIAYGIAVDGNENVYITGGYSDYLTVKYDALGNIVWEDTQDNGNWDNAYGVAVDEKGNVYVTGNSYIGSNYDYFTVKYIKYKDAGILSIYSPDTISADAIYIPSVWVKNNSYEDTLSFDIAAYIDSENTHLYTDLKSVNNLPPEDSTFVSFDSWTAPSDPHDLTLKFSILTSDMNHQDDTISKTLYVRDFIPPVIDSAIAYDGTDTIEGIDDDDYVILYFSEPTNKPTIDNSNINNILALSGGHSWLDGFGIIGNCLWNSDGTQLLIHLSTNVSAPTVAEGDTITPDGITIQDLNGNPCSQPVVLRGSFYASIEEYKRKSEGLSLKLSSINRGVIAFTYTTDSKEKYSIKLYSADGRVIWKREGQETGYHKEIIKDMRGGVYFLRIKQGGKNIIKKLIVEK